MSDMILFHGSRGGIKGDILPISRMRCDFGKGFYMGTNPDQAKTLVANDPDPLFYKLSFDIDSITEERVFRLKDMDWAYFVLYNRGKLDSIKGTSLYKWCEQAAAGKDVIIGPIADDAMNEAMNRFMEGDITDKAFLESIRGLDYGIQYVAKTAEACRYIQILEEKRLFGQELVRAVDLSAQRRREGSSVADAMRKKYRREGKYLDELLSEMS